MTKAFKFLLFCSLFFLQQSAFAQWQLREEKVDPYLGVPSCRVLTNHSTSKDSLQLSLSFPKDRSRAPVAVLALNGDATVKKIEIHLSSTSQTELALPLEGSSYWYIPLRMDQLVDEISKAYTLDIAVETEEGRAPIQISLTGSAFTLLMAKKCLNDEELYDHDFFKDLNESSIEPKEVNGEVSVLRLQDLFQMSYSFFKANKDLESSLRALRDANKEALVQEASVQKNWNQINSGITEAKNSIESLKKQAAQAEHDLIPLGREQQELVSIKERARENLEREQKIFQPLNQKYIQFQRDIVLERKQETQLSGQVETAKAQTIQAQKNFSRLEKEKEALSFRITRMDGENARHKTHRSELQTQLNALDVQKEVTARMSKESVFQQAQAALRDLGKILEERQAQAKTAKIAQQKAQINFERCRLAHLDQEALPCQAEMTQLQQAQAENHTKQSFLRETNAQISSEQDKIETLRKNISQVVLEERNRLQQQLDEVNGKISALENWLERSRKRILEIDTKEIPDNKKQITAAADLIAQCQLQITESKNRSVEMKRSFELFKAGSLYSQKQENFLKAQKALEVAEGELRAKESQIRSARLVIDHAKSEIPRIQSRLSFIQSQAPQARRELQRVEEGLDQFHRQETLLQKQIAENKSQYDLSLRHYRYALLKVLNH